MTISARIVADSIQKNGRHRLTTFVLKYPRYVHAEFMTHRVFSRNAASSRAIPIQKMIERIIKEPAVPVHWGRNQAGMQAATELTGWRLWLVKQIWLKTRYVAIAFAWLLWKIGLHKQISNRILEPWMHIEVVCTGTDFANFYALRNHPMAQPEMQELAKAMLRAHEWSKPQVLKPGQWHLPFIKNEDLGEMYIDHLFGKDHRVTPPNTEGFQLEERKKLFDWHLAQLSAARCARVSYLKHDGSTATREEDIELYFKLMGGNPKHASPAEHQAMVLLKSRVPQYESNRYRSNLSGWISFRKMHDGETVHESP